MQLSRYHRSKKLIRKSSLCTDLDLSRSGFDKLQKNDPKFPKPVKFGGSRQSAVFFVVAEIDAWLADKIRARDAE